MSLTSDRLSCWLKTPRSAAELWFGRPSVVVAWLGLIAAALTPPGGLGVPLCWFYSATGIPCPGCGITRSVSCALRGMLVQSWHYHPMGILVLMLFIFTAAQSVLPAELRNRLHRFIEVNAVWSKGFYLLFVALFVTFGTLRALVYIAASCHLQFA